MSLGLPKPVSGSSNGDYLLIYGGSTATGMYGIQYAKASGLRVIATSSPRNFELLKSLGADAVFDYRSNSCVDDIRAFAKQQLYLSWDCTGDGVEICAKAMEQSSKSVYGTIVPSTDEALFKSLNPHADGPRLVLGYDGLGAAYKFGGNPRPYKQRESEYAASFAEAAEQLLQSKVIRPIPISLNPTGHGLKSVVAGLDRLRNGQVSAQKLVYMVE
jgi:NADPH:quinone reductase-like Zn-dependent oxidoreductase